MPIPSPDGRYLLISGNDARGGPILWVRPIDAETAQPLAGTEAGLIGYWPLTDGSGAVAHDRSGGGHDGTITGGAPAWTTNRTGAVILQGGTP